MPASVAGHVAILILLLWAAAPRRLPVPPERPIAVDILSESQFAALHPPAVEPVALLMVASPTPEPDPVQSILPPAPESGPQPVKATKFFASGILSDPANREIAEALPLLAGDEQVIQLCNMEALEQLRVARVAGPPDAVVGYAYGDMVLAGQALTAEGGAFRSQGQWFHLQYHCAATADARSVRAFDFTLGDAIPESEWEEHALNGSDEGLD
ncbi:DUF930 domain-containing protein [Devosia sp. YR412]|uniref:DUF930 domain-containing protein n=1 Tax=Devosia sp. YR412 TaxID=1881030 RepID=UPI00147DF8AA|nr:DUF930 domain-containing protein [Devosia sp. YR412]